MLRWLFGKRAPAQATVAAGPDAASARSVIFGAAPPVAPDTAPRNALPDLPRAAALPNLAIPAGCSLDFRQLVQGFESFGENCEFGFIQRAAAAEPISLFRFSAARLPDIIHLVQTRFAEVGEDASVQLDVQPHGEYYVRFNNQFTYHTFIKQGDVDPEKLRQQELQRIRFMKRNLLDDLENAEKILVFRGPPALGWDAMAPLHQAVREIGPSTLLWITPEDERHPGGSVERIADGALRGYISTPGILAPFPHFTQDEWLELCAEAFRLVRRTAPPSLPMGSNLLPAPQIPQPTFFAECRPVVDIPPVYASQTVYAHTLLHAGAVHASFQRIADGLPPGQVYVVSFYVWVPAEFSGRVVAPVILGRPTQHYVPAPLQYRDQWHFVWASARLEPDQDWALPALNVQGNGDDVVYTTGWRFEAGDIPSGYLFRNERPRLVARRPTPKTRRNLVYPTGNANAEGWRGAQNMQTETTSDVPPWHEAEPVLRHSLTGPMRDTIHSFWARRGLRPGMTYCVSVWVWLPEEYQGGTVAAVCHGLPSAQVVEANPRIRKAWQRVWTTALLPAGADLLIGGLLLFAEANDTIYSTCWKVEEGDTPTPFVPDHEDLLPAAWLDRRHWRDARGWASAPSDEVPAHIPSRAVLRHLAGPPDDTGNLTIHASAEALQLASGRGYVVSCWVWVPWDFTGTVISVGMQGTITRALQPALLGASFRNRWQRIFTQVETTEHQHETRPELLVAGTEGDMFYSTGWKVEEGKVPTG